MIGSLRGLVIYKARDRIEVDIGGVGFEVFLANRDLGQIKSGEEKEIFVYHHLAEGVDQLYGFLQRKDKRVFQMLISVSGIGPKTALEIFSVADGEKIMGAIAQADVGFFQQVKGIGKKGAQRIIVDLKQLVGSVRELDLEKEEGQNEIVYQALSRLGFRRNEIRKALLNLPAEIKSDDQKIKFALKKLAENV